MVRDYQHSLKKKLLSEINETHRNWKSALLIQNSKEQKEMLSFVTQYQLLVSTLIEALMEKRNLNHYTEPCQIFKEPPIIQGRPGGGGGGGGGWWYAGIPDKNSPKYPKIPKIHPNIPKTRI